MKTDISRSDPPAQVACQLVRSQPTRKQVAGGKQFPLEREKIALIVLACDSRRNQTNVEQSPLE